MAEHVVEFAESLIEQALRAVEKLANAEQKQKFNAIIQAKLRKDSCENHHIGPVESAPKATEDKKPRGVLFDDPVDAKPIPSRAKATDEDFDKFWKIYPRKVNKAKARESFDRAFKKLRAKHTADEAVKIICDGARIYATKANPEALCHPTTWLNGARWEDDPEAIATPSLADAKMSSRLKAARHGTYDESEEILDPEEARRRAML